MAEAKPRRLQGAQRPEALGGCSVFWEVSLVVAAGGASYSPALGVINVTRVLHHVAPVLMKSGTAEVLPRTGWETLTRWRT